MFRLLQKIAAFVLLPTPILFGLWWSFETSVKYREDSLYRQHQDFLAAPERLDYLVLGHSRARNSIDVERLGSAFSLATPGESFVETHAHLRYVLEHSGKQVRTVILPIGLGTMKPMSFRRGHYWVRFVNYWEVGLLNGQPLRYLAAALQDRVLPYRSIVKRRLAGGVQPRDRVGEEGSRARESALADLGPQERERQLEWHLQYIAGVGLLDPAAMKSLRDVLRLLARHRVEAVFVKFPVSAPLLEGVRAVAREQDFPEQGIDALIRADARARLLDYQELFADREDVFEDHNHLNAAGRELFTDQFLADLSRGDRAEEGRRPGSPVIARQQHIHFATGAAPTTGPDSAEQGRRLR